MISVLDLRRLSPIPSSRLVRLSALGALLLTTAASTLTSIQLRDSAYVTWSQISTSVHEGLWIPLSLLAGYCGGMGSRLFSQASFGGPSTQGGMRVLRFTQCAFAIAFAATCGWLVGIVPWSFVLIQRRAPGSLSMQAVVLAGLGVCAVTILSLAIGAAMRAWQASIACSVLAFGMLGLTQYGSLAPLGLLFPVRHFPTTPRFHLSPATTTYFILINLVVLTFLVLLFGYFASRRTAWNIGGVLPSFMGAAIVALFCIGFVWRPEFFEVNRPVLRSCSEVEGHNVCVHRENTPASPEIASAIAGLHSAGLLSASEKIIDRDLPEYVQARKGEVLIGLDPSPVSGVFIAQTLREQIVFQVIEQAVLAGCASGNPSATSYEAAILVASKMMALSGEGDMAGRMSPAQAVSSSPSIGAERIHQILASHPTEISQCKLDPAVLSR